MLSREMEQPSEQPSEQLIKTISTGSENPAINGVIIYPCDYTKSATGTICDISDENINTVRAELNLLRVVKWRYGQQFAMYTMSPLRTADVLWTHFRNTNIESIAKYGPATYPDEVFNDELETQYKMNFEKMFIRFMRMDTAAIKDKPLSLRYSFDNGQSVDIWRIHGIKSKFHHLIQLSVKEQNDQVWTDVKRMLNVEGNLLVMMICTDELHRDKLDLFGVIKDVDYSDFTPKINASERICVHTHNHESVNTYNGIYSGDVYSNIATADEFATVLGIDVIDFDSTADELTNYWRYFRVTDVSSITKYGFPKNNKGEPVQDFDQIDNNYIIVQPVFSKFIAFDIDKPVTLIIQCKSGGIYIRRIYDYKHAFVTADMPGVPEYDGIAEASYTC